MKLDSEKLRKLVLETLADQDTLDAYDLESDYLKKEWKEFISFSSKNNIEPSSDKQRWLRIANLRENLEDEVAIDRMLQKTVDILKIVYNAAKEETERGEREGENRRFLFLMINAAGESADSTGQDIDGKRQSIINAADFFRANKSKVPASGQGIVDELISFVGNGQSQQLA